MPLMEALDNSGKPTGRTRMFSTSEYNRMQKIIKKPKWRLIQGDAPRYREKPKTNRPAEKNALLGYISECTDRDELNEIMSKDGRRTVREAAENRIKEVTNKP